MDRQEFDRRLEEADKSIDWDAFHERLDAYQAGLREEVEEATIRSYLTAARPQADRQWTTFAELRVGDFITAEGPGGRWVRVNKIAGPMCSSRTRRQLVPDGYMRLTFEIPEPVSVSGETGYVIERKLEEPVVYDRSARAA